MKYLLTLILAGSILAYGQTARPEVLTLGVFHFNFPNLDARQTSKADQIDVLEPKYQQEIEDIVRRLAKFDPTIIAIERQPDRQLKTDSTYNLYLQGKHTLTRDEGEQLGFRLAKLRGIRKLYCVDEWGNFNQKIGDIVFERDSAGAKKFEEYFLHNPDSAKKSRPETVFKTQGIMAQLRSMNSEQRIRESMGDYLIGLFKYESEQGDFLGVDFETGRWFSRNLKIFRNIQRIPTTPSDRIVVIYGAGHLNILNYLFGCSPEYRLLRTNDYLQ